ncbi:MAG TPA: hypothetical protein VJ124_05350 [Pyrinomonadaceae bacterium]|nr:hypothetical protein [Pyrinomonadaceae bacterium]
MSKLPVISGAQYVKMLGRIALKSIDNVAVTSYRFASRRPRKPPFPITKNSIAARCGQSSAKQVSR